MSNDIRKYINLLEESMARQLEPVPLWQTFGKPEFIAIREAGFKMMEKPGYFSEINDSKYAIPKGVIGAIGKTIGRNINTYSLEHVIRPFKGRYYPQGTLDTSALQNPNEETFILQASTNGGGEYKPGDEFLANRTGATSYIRMWSKLV